MNEEIKRNSILVWHTGGLIIERVCLSPSEHLLPFQLPGGAIFRFGDLNLEALNSEEL
jgi:hypothetical protein